MIARIFIINKQKREEMKFGAAILCLLVATTEAAEISKFRWGYSRHYLSKWCGHSGSRTTHADINGDGKADLICDDSKGNHWVRLVTDQAGKLLDLGLVKSKWCSHKGSYTQWADVDGDGKADMICDDLKGNHWFMLSRGDGKFTNVGLYKKGWCGHAGSRTNWADVNGDGTADMLCDDTKGRHWYYLTQKS